MDVQRRQSLKNVWDRHIILYRVAATFSFHSPVMSTYWLSISLVIVVKHTGFLDFSINCRFWFDVYRCSGKALDKHFDHSLQVVFFTSNIWWQTITQNREQFLLRRFYSTRDNNAHSSIESNIDLVSSQFIRRDTYILSRRSLQCAGRIAAPPGRELANLWIIL